MKLLVNLYNIEVMELKPNENFGDQSIDPHKEFAYALISFAPAPKFQFQHPKPTTPNQSAILYLPANENTPFEESTGERMSFNTEDFQRIWPSGFLSFVNTVIAVENYLQRIGYKPQLEETLAELVDRA